MLRQSVSVMTNLVLNCKDPILGLVACRVAIVVAHPHEAGLGASHRYEIGPAGCLV